VVKEQLNKWRDSEISCCFYVQSCVISLSKLIVREKADTRDNCGIYLICQSRQSPEMYELVCRSVDDRTAWLTTLKHAIANCTSSQHQGIIHLTTAS